MKCKEQLYSIGKHRYRFMEPEWVFQSTALILLESIWLHENTVFHIDISPHNLNGLKDLGNHKKNLFRKNVVILLLKDSMYKNQTQGFSLYKLKHI